MTPETNTKDWGSSQQKHEKRDTSAEQSPPR